MGRWRHIIPGVIALVVGVAGCDGVEEECYFDRECPGREVCARSGGILFENGVCVLRCSTDESAEACRQQGGSCREGYCVGRRDATSDTGVADVGDTTGDDTAPDDGGDVDGGEVCMAASTYDFCVDNGFPCGSLTATDRCGRERQVDCETVIDFETEEFHCGECNNTCQFDHADGECRAGVCDIDSCEEGYVDLDGTGNNGCECEVADSEDCDGEDNDCDGTVDEGCPCDWNGDADGVCGDATLDEDGNCPQPESFRDPELDCEDGLDNDCDGDADGDDDNCADGAVGRSCTADADCRSEACITVDSESVCAHRLLVSSDNFSGKLEGLGNADDRCQQFADRQSLGGTWQALLSTGSRAAKDRLSIRAPVVNTDGTKIADGAGDLWDGTLAHPVVPSDDPAASAFVWTGTRPDGTGAEASCRSWTNPSHTKQGQHGDPTATSEAWLEADGTRDCDDQGRLYCISGQ